MIDRYQLATIYQRMPGNQPVTLMVRDRTNDAAATYTSYSLNFVRKKPVTTEQRREANIEASGVEACGWVVWGDDLRSVSAPEPREGDIIADPTRLTPAGQPRRWTIKKVDAHLLEECHQLTCEAAF